MPLERIKWALAAVWLIAAVSLSLFVPNVTWLIWTAFVALAVLPPLALLLWWNEPPLTMSETIHEARSKTWPS